MAEGDNSNGMAAGCGTLIAAGIFLLICWFVTAWFLPDGWRIKYAMANFVSYENVLVEVRPTDCDFLRSPIGIKSCRYEKTITTMSWKKSTSDLPIVSYDGGKTWTQIEPSPGSNVKIPSEHVYVGWNKVEGP